MKDEDIDAVMDIWLETNITAHHFIPEEYWLGNFQAVRGEYLPKSDNYVYDDNGEIKGFISVLQPSYIGALFVSKKNHGQGIGRLLIEHCKSKYGFLDVAVYAENQQALGFYQKQGFQIAKEQVNPDLSQLEYILEWCDEME